MDSAFLNDLDELIRRGEGRQARLKLMNIDYTKIDRALRARIANIYTRVGRPDVSLRVLHRSVRSQDETKRPSDAEKVQYALALHAVGASDEALKLLNKVPAESEPNVHLFTSLVHFSKWNYSEALPHIQKFIDHPLASEYQKVVGHLNLAAALIFLRDYSQAYSILKELLQHVDNQEQYRLVIGNLYELLAQVAVNLEDVAQANFYIESAEKMQKMHSGITTLFLKKWRALSKTLVPEEKEEGIRELQLLTREASRRRHWETLRETHFFLSKLQRDDSSFLRVYFGTPHLNYRTKILREYSQAPPIPDQFIYHLQNSTDRAPLIFDVVRGKIEGRRQSVALGSLPHRLLVTLCTDLFRPFRVSKLFSILYPDEYFDPFSSPHRVHETIARLRAELKTQGIPLVIKERSGEYSVTCPGAMALRLPQSVDLGSRNGLILTHLIALFGREKSFNNELLRKHLQLSQRSVNRFTRWAIDNNLLKKDKRSGVNFYSVTS